MPGWGQIYSTTSYALSQQVAQLARLQEQTASGLRVIRGSDDPNAAYQILTLRHQGETYKTYQDNLLNTSDSLQSCYNVLQQVGDDLSSAVTGVTQVASGTYGQTQRDVIAEQVDSLLKECLSLANTQRVGKYTFGGDSVDKPPYVVTTVNGKITAVTYQGSDQELKVPVAPGMTYSGYMIGDNIFRTDKRQAPVLLGSTGAASGSGTSSVRGDQWLSVTHTNTVYNDAGASGLAVGVGSADGDTILGTHTLTIDTQAKTISLDNGQAVHYDGTQTNLKLTNGSGDCTYVDMSGLTAGAGTVSLTITSQGQLSLDGGKTHADITFRDNDAVTDPATGGVLYVNTSSLARTGEEPVRVPGTYDLFSTLINLRDVLANTRGLSSDQQVKLLDQGLNSLQELTGGVTQTMTQVGARVQAMDRLNTVLIDMQNSCSDRQAVLSDADIPTIAIELTRVSTFYQMTMTSASKLMKMSLLDYI